MRETLALGTCVIMVRTSEMGGLGVKQTIAALGRSQTKAIIVFDKPAAQTGWLVRFLMHPSMTKMRALNIIRIMGENSPIEELRLK